MEQTAYWRAAFAECRSGGHERGAPRQVAATSVDAPHARAGSAGPLTSRTSSLVGTPFAGEHGEVGLAAELALQPLVLYQVRLLVRRRRR